MLVAIFGVLLLGEQLSRTNWLSILLNTVGVILVAWQK
ncbi:MAG: hypothetical protein ACRC0U_05940 [Vibrio sp.]